MSSQKKNHDAGVDKNKPDLSTYALSEAYAQIEKEREKFQRVFDSSNDALMLLDDTQFFDANDATIQLFGYKSKKEFLGKHPGEVSPSVQADGMPSKDAANERIATAFKEGKNYFEWTHRRADGTDFPATVLLTPLEIEGKKVLQATVRDITDEKLAQAKLLALDRLKSRFITTLSHVTRTPLNRIRWSLESLLEEEIEEGHDSHVKVIQKALQNEAEVLRVIQVMNTTLDIERGTLVVNMAPTSLISLIRSVKETISKEAIDRDIEWREEIPADKMSAVEIDSEKLRLVIRALLDNAVTYGGEEDAWIKITLTQNDKFVRCSVEDNGIGIPDGEKAYATDRFFRASNAQTRNPNGMGLGLHIAKAIIEAHHGKIGIDSQENKGTTVWFTLPLSGSNL